MVESRFKKNVLASRKNKSLGFFFDFALTLVCMIVIYLVMSMIVPAGDKYKESLSEASKMQKELYAYVDRSQLSYKDANNRLLSADEAAEKYLKGSVLYTLKKNGKSEVEIAYSNYSGFEEINKDNDGLYNYYVNFKPENLNEFKDAVRYGLSYYINYVIEVNKYNYFEIVDNYPEINLDTANAIDEYFRNNKYSIGKDCYDQIKNKYAKAWGEATIDLAENSKIYLELIYKFDQAKNVILGFKVINVVLCYVFSFLIIKILPILIFKDGQTFGHKVLHQAYTTIDGNKISFGQYAGKEAINFVTYFWVIVLFAFLFYRQDGAYLLFYEFKSLNLFVFALASFILLVLSTIAMIVNKSTKQSLSEYASRTLCKNTKVIEINEGKINE